MEEYSKLYTHLMEKLNNEPFDLNETESFRADEK